MESPRRPHPADPEFDPFPASTVRLREFHPEEHQRLVVNPFLAVFGLIAWWQIARWLFHSWFPPLAAFSAVFLAALPLLIQYHCLDCGRTGSYHRRWRHVCPAVQARWERRESRRFPIPLPRSQLIVWAYLIGSASLLYAVS